VWASLFNVSLMAEFYPQDYAATLATAVQKWF
jgi:hypothetical protein